MNRLEMTKKAWKVALASDQPPCRICSEAVDYRAYPGDYLNLIPRKFKNGQKKSHVVHIKCNREAMDVARNSIR